VIFTGNGVHVYWLLKELEIFEDASEREQTHRTVWRWQTLLCQMASAAHGWRLDRLADLARVLRPPGTHNFKDRKAPKEVVVYSQSERRYNLSEFNDLADRMGIPESDAPEASSAGDSAASSAPRALGATATRRKAGAGLEGPFEINLKAAIPEETLASWLENDLQFHKTWLLKRPEFDSPSEYDLALCNFALDLHLPAQTAVDLIVHHRRLHRKKSRTHKDYFERTMAKAQTSSLPGVRPLPTPLATPAAPATPETGSTTPVAPAPEAVRPAKGVLVAWISQEMNLPKPATQILKITGSEPSYQILFADGTRIVLPDIGSLLDQNRLRWAIAASALNYRIPTFKPAPWGLIADRILESLTEIEGGSENELAGALQAHLERYLYGNRFVSGEDLSALACQLPGLIDGQIAISAQHLQHTLEFQHIRLSIREITSGLVTLGAEQRRIRKWKKCDQSRWLLPLDSFPPSDYGQGPVKEEKPEPERKPN
jgi:hypothetical protein